MPLPRRIQTKKDIIKHFTSELLALENLYAMIICAMCQLDYHLRHCYPSKLHVVDRHLVPFRKGHDNRRVPSTHSEWRGDGLYIHTDDSNSDTV